MLKQRNKPTDNGTVVFDNKTEDKEFKRYKRVEYCKLAARTLLGLILGMIVSFLIKQGQ